MQMVLKIVYEAPRLYLEVNQIDVVHVFSITKIRPDPHTAYCRSMELDS